MDLDEIQCKFPRLSNGNGRLDSSKIGNTGQKMDDQFPDEEEEGERKRGGGAGVGSGAIDLSGGVVGRLFNWPSSRIVRVSRASGGKDRHSKVLTSKGLRDRRVRLSVNTAIQFYDLQDRLGYDQPSKAVEWLLKAAASSISELPPMTTPFPDTPKQLSDEKRSSTGGSDQLVFDSAELNMDGGGGGGDPNYPQHAAKSSACSSTSETSKGSGLSLSRSENRVKARERAKERVAEKETEPSAASLNTISQTTSFTELLNGGLNNVTTTTDSPNDSVHQHPNTNESNFFQKSPRQWATDYFTRGLLGPPVSRSGGQMQLAHPLMVGSPLFSVAGDHHPELPPHLSFVSDHHLVQVGGNNCNSNSNSNHHHHNNNGGGNDYNLSFTISPSANSSGLAGFSRGTLQSNSSSPSLLPHLQRLSPIDGSAHPSFFLGAAAAASPVENHHQFLSGFDGRALQLCYGDAHANNGRQSGHNGKGKNN